MIFPEAWKNIRGGLLTWSVLGLTLLFSASVRAQVTGATLSGTVTDASGAVVPQAQVSIKNLATGVTTTVKSDAAGFYTAPNLLPGSYEISASAAGFSTQVQSGVTLTVGAQQVLNFVLRVGQVTQTVQVTGEAPTVELASSTISAVVSSDTVVDLPLNGRSWTALATLQPGVSAIKSQVSLTSGASRAVRGYGDQISVSGARPQENNYRLDGISINDYSNGGPGSVLGGNLGVDAIQEFSVLTSNYSAEYGRTAGGVVNAITRSGTNLFHGSVYEFLRNSGLDARNFFDGATIPPFKRNQFGASGGGPIRKDKVFVFADYEGIRQSLGFTTLGTAPSVAARNGMLCSLPDTTPACTPHTITVDPSAQKYLSFWPIPNGGIRPGTNGDIGTFSFGAQRVVTENFFTTRVDARISGKDNLTATYLGDIAPYTSPDNLDTILLTSKTNRQIAILEETHTFSAALVNATRLGYSRETVVQNASSTVLNPLAGDPSAAAIPGRFAAVVNVTGLSTFSGGVDGNNHGTWAWNSFQAYDDAFLTHGNHFLKFGGAVERIQDNYLTPIDHDGTFSFGALSAFLTNKPQRFSTGLVATPRALRQTLFGLYIEDDWHARPNLTVNLGLRWEMVTVPTETQDKLASLLNITDPTPHLGSPFYSNPTLRNFEPRAGFAWDPFQNGKMAVRGGFGVFDVLPFPYQFTGPVSQAFPFSQGGAASPLPPGSFYSGAAGLLGPTSNTESYIEQHPKRDYVMQWNLNVQRQIIPNLTAFVGYIGSRGVHLPFRIDDANIVMPMLTTQGYLYPSPVASGNPINPNFGILRTMLYKSNSFYHALEAELKKRMSHGVQIQGSFTWGKSIDTSSSTVAGDQFTNSISSLLPWTDPSVGRGLSDFNVGRTLVINATWNIPSAKSLSGPAAWIANGWELGAIYTANDGIPFTATFGTNGDPQGINNNDPWDFPNRLTGSGCTSLTNPGNPNNYIKAQCFGLPTAPSLAFWNANCDPAFGTPFNLNCFNLRGNSGRNILIGPGTSNLDFSVFKNNAIRRISESFQVQFRAEFFNILNRANFAVPITPDNTDIFDSGGAQNGAAGLLTSTTTTAREIQFALKLIW